MFVIMSEDCELLGVSKSFSKCYSRLMDEVEKMEKENEDSSFQLREITMPEPTENVRMFEIVQMDCTFGIVGYSIEKVADLDN